MNERSIVIEYKGKKNVFAYIRRNPSTKNNDFFVSVDQLSQLKAWKEGATSLTFWIEPAKRPKVAKGKIVDYYPVHKEESEEVDYYIAMLELVE